MVANEDVVRAWIDKLAIREVIERAMRCIDDQDGPRLAELFADDGVMQLAGLVMDRDAINAIGSGVPHADWTAEGELLKQPASTHLSSNPVIEITNDTATAETDMIVFNRDESGRARITLVARYRDRLRRDRHGGWLITNRTGVSIWTSG